MSRPKSTLWKCPKCGATKRAFSAYHLKSCKGPSVRLSTRRA